MKQLHRQLLGKLGEDFATDYLRKQKFIILERNFKKRYGEIDIIARQGQVLVFIEVKTRIGRAFGLPEESVTLRKLQEVKQTALLYKSFHPELPEQMRIDVISIELHADHSIANFKHIPNVTI